MAIGVNDTVVVGDAGGGRHVVALSGVASNCQIQGSAIDTVTVADGSTADASFTDHVRIRIGRRRPDPGDECDDRLEPGSRWLRDPARRQPSRIDPIGRQRDHRRHPAGSHAVGLDSLASGCQVSGDNPQTLTVVADSTSTAAFAIACGSTPSGSIGQWTAEAQPNNAFSSTLGKRTGRFLRRRNRPDDADAGVIEHYDGSSWVEQSASLRSSWMRYGGRTNDVYAAGGTTTSSRVMCSITMEPPGPRSQGLRHARDGRHPRALAIGLGALGQRHLSRRCRVRDQLDPAHRALRRPAVVLVHAAQYDRSGATRRVGTSPKICMSSASSMACQIPRM